MAPARRIVMLACAIPSLMLAGCFGRDAAPAITGPTAASIEYRLPVTTAKLSLQLTLQSCPADGPIAEGKVTITPVANPGDAPAEHYRIDGANLQSFTRSRSISVERYSNEALKSINGEVADRTGAIISNILSIGGGLVGLVGTDSGRRATSPTCNLATRRALEQVNQLTARIAAFRLQLPGASEEVAHRLRQAIDALAGEVARLRTEELQLSLEREINFRAGLPGVQRTRGGVITWTEGDLAKWLQVEARSTTTVTHFKLAYCVDPTAEAADVRCNGQVVEQQAGQEAEAVTRLPEGERERGHVASPGCFDPDIALRCPRSLVFRDPVAARLRVIAHDSRFEGKTPNEQMAQSSLWIAQWGTLTELPLSVGFGGNFTMAAGFDEFGRRTSLTWKSGARGEGITGAISPIVTAGTALNNAFTTELEMQQQEITRLETQQKLNRLEFCRQVIEAGGFNCPTP